MGNRKKNEKSVSKTTALHLKNIHTSDNRYTVNRSLQCSTRRQYEQFATAARYAVNPPYKIYVAAPPCNNLIATSVVSFLLSS